MLRNSVVRAVFVALALVSGVVVSVRHANVSGAAVVLAGEDEPTRPTKG